MKAPILKDSKLTKWVRTVYCKKSCGNKFKVGKEYYVYLEEIGNGASWIHVCFDPDPKKTQFEVTTPFYIGDPNLFGNLPIPPYNKHFLSNKEYRKMKLKKIK